MAFSKERKGIIERYGRGGTAISDTGIMLSRDGVNFELSKTAFAKPEYDSVNREVEFEKPLSDLVGKEIKIRFKLKDCHLYSYTFEKL